MFFYIVVYDYADVIMFVKTIGVIPKIGEEFEINFDNQTAEFIDGSWGNVGGRYLFERTRQGQSPDFIIDSRFIVPVVEVQLEQ